MSATREIVHVRGGLPLRAVRAALVATWLVATQAFAPSVATAADPAARPGRLMAEGDVTPAQVTAAAVLNGFTDSVIFSSLTAPIAVRFSPDGRVFVAEKSGLIKVFASLTATTPTVVADLRPQVDNYWDRGLLGFTLDPNFPTTPYIYALYSYDAMIGGTSPAWNDACLTPPGPTTDGCPISGRLSRINATTGAEQVLVNDWCQQFPSHSVGELRFGPDGALYASSGDGASFTFVDYGQAGGGAGSPTPKNPCGDPPGGVGGTMSAPTAEGGALRSQGVRRPAGQSIPLNGALLRLDPTTGAAMPDNPLAGNASANARRIVGFGFRNPFRFTFRPGTNEVWIGDVGADTWEEINRIVNPKAATVANGGWPCYEGPGIDGAYQAANLDLCTSLYGNPTGLLQPMFTYQHQVKIISTETCDPGSSSISGIAFYGAGTYPTLYNNALFFADHSRNCIWAVPAGGNGLPDFSKVADFIQGASNPVALEIGPGGDLFYVDHEGGAIHRVTYSATNHPPVAAIQASPTSGNPPLTVNFDGSASSDPDPGDTLTYSWDLDGDGTFGDATLATASRTFTTAGLFNVGLRVTDSRGATATTTIPINVGGNAPVPVIDSPGASFTWAVGDPIAFSGHATDSAGVAIPASKLSWTFVLHHCPSSCHTHVVQTIPGVASGTISAPDHDYPSYLEVQLTATDSASRTATASVNIQPKTANLSVATVPSGLSIGVGVATPAPAPFTRQVIANSVQTVSAPPTQTMGAVTYTFVSWSDGGAASHNVTVPLAGKSLTATYAGSGSTTAYLSDLAWTTVANGWGPVEKDRSNGEKSAGDGLPLTLNTVVYAKGLGAHAASDIRYAMNGTCTSFSTKVGVDDEAGSNGSITFRILADGTTLFDSGVMTGTSATQTATVNVTGRTTLQLVIDPGADMNYDHGDWADAQLTCGGGGPPPDTTPPTVTGRTPAAGATNVATSVRPTVTFSEPIDPTTVTTTNMTLTPNGGAAVAATVAYDGPSQTATLTPTSALVAGTTYTVRVKGGATGIADLATNRLVADATSTFSTAAAPDTTPPTVTGRTPAAGATNVATSVRPTVTFSEPIDPTTVTTTNMTLTPNGGAAVAATVAYDGPSQTATLTPTSALVAGTTYTVRVKGGATGIADLATNRLVADATSTFSTAAGSGSTTAYLSDLAWTTVANGWGPVEKDRSNGEKSAGDGLPLTLNTVVYAKGLGAHAASDIRYAMNGTCTSFSTKVGVDDEAGSNGSITFRILADGTTLFDSGVMTGTSATQTATVNVTGRTTLQLVIDPGADMNYDHGDWADAQLTCGGGGPPPDTTPPTVTGRTPAAGATNVATSVRPTVTFSEPIDPTTVTTTNMTLTPNGGAAVAATVAYDGPSQTATLTPTSALVAGTTYTVRVKGGATGIADLATNRLVADATSTFSTAAAPDTTPPTVTGRTPAAGATNVATSVRPTVTFSEPIDPTTVTTTNMTLTPNGGAAVAATVAYDGPSQTATLTPTSALVAGTTYTVRVKGGATGIADLATNRLVADATSTFSTAAGSGSTTAYLSDLAWTTVANGWGPVEKDRSNGEKSAGDGLPLTLNTVVYAKGLGAHAASDIRYAMNGTCTSFSTKVGVDDEAGSNGSITFRILADGTTLFDSGVMTGTSATQTATVNVTGRTTLQLVIDPGADMNYDHGDWADAQLTCGA